MQSKTDHMRKLLLTATFAIPFAAAASMAQAEYGDEEEGGFGAEAVEVSDQEIADFAEAMMDVQEIGQEWSEQMQQAEDQAQMEEYREQSREEMVAAIERHGLTVEEYNNIATAAQNDPDLAQQIQEEAGAGEQY